MMKKKATTLLAVLLMGAIALTGCSAPHTVNGSAEAVSVNGTSVPLGELNFYLRYQQANMQNAYGGMFGETFMNTDITGSGSVYGVTMRDSSLETLEEYYLVEANAEELGISLTDEDESKIADTVQAFLAANDSKTLDAMTADEATVTHVLELITLQQRVHEYFGTTIDTEVDPEEANQKCCMIGTHEALCPFRHCCFFFRCQFCVVFLFMLIQDVSHTDHFHDFLF